MYRYSKNFCNLAPLICNRMYQDIWPTLMQSLPLLPCMGHKRTINVHDKDIHSCMQVLWPAMLQVMHVLCVMHCRHIVFDFCIIIEFVWLVRNSDHHAL